MRKYAAGRSQRCRPTSSTTALPVAEQSDRGDRYRRRAVAPLGSPRSPETRCRVVQKRRINPLTMTSNASDRYKKPWVTRALLNGHGWARTSDLPRVKRPLMFARSSASSTHRHSSTYATRWSGNPTSGYCHPRMSLPSRRRLEGRMSFTAGCCARGGRDVRRSLAWPQMRRRRRASGDREGHCNPRTQSACVRAITRALLGCSRLLQARGSGSVVRQLVPERAVMLGGDDCAVERPALTSSAQ